MKNKIYWFSDILLKVLAFFVPINPRKVVLINRVTSGSNVNLVTKELKEKYPSLDVREINDSKVKGLANWLKLKLKMYWHLLRAKVVVTTHGPVFKSFKNITIDLWHAFPTKKSGLMLGKDSAKRVKKMTDYFLSYSSFSTILLNSRYGMKASKYIELGSPRNDYLLNPRRGNRKPSFLENWKDHKVVFYLPTFRDYGVEGKYKLENLRFEKFDLEKFNLFLEENKILFVMKFHRNEEEKWWDVFEKFNFSNIILLKEEYLDEGFQDFYEVLSYSDLLITDYSSIYVDYLLLNKPMIFTPTDMEEYNECRGLLLEPYDFWRPGPVCTNQAGLQKELMKSLEEQKYYRNERETISHIFHKYEDGKSTERVVNFIYNKLKGE